MRLLSWNIERGGEDLGWRSSRPHHGRRHARIVETLLADGRAPDVVVFTEFRTRHWENFRQMLSDAGWRHVITSEPGAEENGVCICARTPLRRSGCAQPDLAHPERWLEVEVPDHGLSVVGLYGPLKKQRYRAFWEGVLAAAEERATIPTVITGDLNTGESLVDAPRDDFFCSSYFMALQQRGWIDAWRSGRPSVREFSYYHRRRVDRDDHGYRIDHALLSPALAVRPYRCWYSHDERLANVSDHSALLLDIG